MTILSAIVMLGILIFVHELGHFLFAKMAGVGVLKFSLGFGPRIIGKKVGETDYQISAVPLGGYVKMLGEEVGEELAETDRARAFQFQPIWKRALIVLAGPAFNILLTYLIYTVVLAAHIPVSIPNLSAFMPVIREVTEESPAAKAGLRAGDRVLAVDGKPVETWIEVIQGIVDAPGRNIMITVRRDGGTREVTVTPEAVEVGTGEERMTIGRIGIEKDSSPVIGDFLRDSPAVAAGMKRGDRILAIDGVRIATWEDMVRIVRQHPGRELGFSVQRGKDVVELRIVPKEVAIQEGDTDVIIGQIGVFKANFYDVVESGSFGEALYKGAVVTYRMAFFIFDSIKMIFSGEVSLKNIGGPVTIVKESGKAAAAGVLPYFLFMALFSVNLGILNLLPVPVLDGGHLLLFVLERAKGSPLNERAVGIVNRIGLAFIIALMMLAFYNDFVRLISGR